jgi:chromate transport protein ChrA
LAGVSIASLALMASVTWSLGRGAVVDQTFQTQIIKNFIRNACFFVGEVNTLLFISFFL